MPTNLKFFFKNNKKDILIGIVAFFVIALSFALGYIAARDFSMTSIVIEKCSGN
jgi:hypothetical protein